MAELLTHKTKLFQLGTLDGQEITIPDHPAYGHIVLTNEPKKGGVRIEIYGCDGLDQMVLYKKVLAHYHTFFKFIEEVK